MEKIIPRFKAEASNSKYCQCDSCREIGTIYRVNVPVTAYWDGRHLTQHDKIFWLCDTCRKRLIYALIHPKEAESNG